MPTFAYKAKNGPGQVVEGLVEAESSRIHQKVDGPSGGSYQS